MPSFEFCNSISEEQKKFFDKNGFIHFKHFISKENVALFLEEIQRIEKHLIDNNIEKVNGIPLKFGQDANGNKIIQRNCFLSLSSKILHEFLQDPCLNSLTELLFPYEGRIAENEKDGLILNFFERTPNSSFTKMGWHTDSPRDIFLGHKIMPMLNIGLHLDDFAFSNGGLRVIPGTHKQKMFDLLFRKKYFIDNTPDPLEVGFDIEAGDLTVHHGSLWHRVQESGKFGIESRRRVMYVPVVTGKFMPKNEKSKTPLYHRFAKKVLK
jgi:ectoine hydroxylase-related dioxygenase (phytanoyl-CoA dioxygenase family)